MRKENQNIEWKESWHDDYLKWLCGFANAQGGRLVIGKNDQGKVVGLANAETLLEDLPNKIRDLLGIMVDVNLQTQDGKDYLEIDVEPYPSPINLRGRYYTRSGSTKQELKGASLTKFLLGKLGRHWDDMPVPYASINDLDATAFEYFRTAAAKSGRMDAAVLNDTNKAIIDNLQLREGRYLRAAAVLLFHKNPEQFVPGAYVKIGFFRSEHDLAYQDEVHGNLFAQAQKTLDLLTTKYMKAYIHYEGVRRIDRFLFPRDALREVLHNALVHRDYSSGVPIQIRVYEDRIRFYNDGCLPEGWTVKKLLRKHKSAPHNPLIAGTFFRTGDIEAWGRGIDTIRTACMEHGSDFPTFESEPTSMMVEFKGVLPTDTRVEGAGNVRDKSGKDSGRTAQEMIPETPGKTRVETLGKTLGKTPGKIAALLLREPHMTVAEIASAISRSESAAQRAIIKLQKAGELRRVGSRKSGYWDVLDKGNT